MVTVAGLQKQFDRSAPPALDGVGFTVNEGEIYGLLGHNGAGKSTALGILLGMVYPDAGEVRVGDLSVQREREKALRQVGAIFETPSFYEYLSGWQNLKVLTALSGGVADREMREVVDWVGLTGRIRHRVGSYSHGMRQRLALAQALLPRPRVLILDEPTDGLDPEGIVEFRERLFELRGQFGVTIVLSSHLLSEVEQVCDRVLILRSGRKIYEGGCRDLGEDRRLFRIEAELPAMVAQAVERRGGSPSGEEHRYSLPEGIEPAELLESLVRAGCRVRHFGQVEPTLEDLYLRVSAGPVKDTADS